MEGILFVFVVSVVVVLSRRKNKFDEMGRYQDMKRAVKTIQVNSRKFI
jgi:hypothetical protein